MRIFTVKDTLITDRIWAVQADTAHAALDRFREGQGRHRFSHSEPRIGITVHDPETNEERTSEELDAEMAMLVGEPVPVIKAETDTAPQLRRNFKITNDLGDYGLLTVQGENREDAALDARYVEYINCAIELARSLAEIDTAQASTPQLDAIAHAFLGRFVREAKEIVSMEEDPGRLTDADRQLIIDIEQINSEIDSELLMDMADYTPKDPAPTHSVYMRASIRYRIDVAGESEDDALENARELFVQSADPEHDFKVMATDAEVEGIDVYRAE